MSKSAVSALALFGLLVGCGGGPPASSDGQSDRPGTGLLFRMDQIGVAERTRGFDLDNACVATDDCVDNRLYQLRFGNPELQRILTDSETIVIVELAGLEPEPAPELDLITVKFFVAEPTADGNFRVAEASLRDGAARSQALATLSMGELRAPVGNELEVVLAASTATTALSLSFRLAVAGLEARIDPGLSRIDRGLVGGAATIPDLVARPNPFCGTSGGFCTSPDQTMLDLVAGAVQPDIDIEPKNGLEQVHVSFETHRVSRCLDGRGQMLEPSNEVEPWTCALRPELTDGYSISFEFEAGRFDGVLK